MSARNDGGPVYPVIAKTTFGDRSFDTLTHPGMTLRDAFAIAALPLANESFPRNIELNLDKLAAKAYMLADAMLAERGP